MAVRLPPFSIAILAGGKSRRMKGIDKLAVELAGKPILAHVLERLEPLRKRADKTFIVAKEIKKFEKFNVEVILDSQETDGPIIGIITALRAASTTHTLVVGGDLPFASPGIGEMLLDRCGVYDLTIPLTGNMYEPLFAVYSKACIDVFEYGLEEGTKKIIDLYPHLSMNRVPENDWRPFDPDDTAFLNINTPEDLEKATQILER